MKDFNVKGTFSVKMLCIHPFRLIISVRIWDIRPFAPQERCVKIMQGHQHTFEKVGH